VLPLDEPIIGMLARCYEDAVGASPQVEGVTYGADMRLLINHAKVPTVLFGPGDVRLAHFTDEFVEIDELVAAAKTLVLAVLRWCR
jgi:acetylornithine deacetylase